VADPIAWAQQCSRGYLFCNCSTTIIQRHVKLDGLARAQRRLAISKLFWHRKQVVPMHEKISIEGCRIQKAPALREAANVAPMSLSEALIRPSAEDWFQHGGVWPTMIISLNIEFHTLALVERVALKLRHDALGSEEEFTLEHVASAIVTALDETPTV